MHRAVMSFTFHSSHDLLRGDPGWAMHPGTEYEYVQLADGHTGVRDKNTGEVFAVETDGLVIVRLWPVLESDSSLKIDTIRPVVKAEAVLVPFTPTTSRTELPKLDVDLLGKWSGPAANDETPGMDALLAAGRILQSTEIAWSYERSQAGSRGTFKPSTEAKEKVAHAFQMLADAVMEAGSVSPMQNAILRAGEIMVRLGQGERLYPGKSAAATKAMLVNIIVLARNRGRIVGNLKHLHDALVDAEKNHVEAATMVQRFKLATDPVALAENYPIPSHSPAAGLTSYKKLTEFVSDLRGVWPDAAAFFKKGSSRE